MTTQERYDHLEQLIKERQLFEKSQPEGSACHQYPTDVNYTNVHGETLLHLACGLGDFNKVQMLISQGADVNKKSCSRWDPIYVAANQGHLEILQYLFKNGAKHDNLKLNDCTGPCKTWFSEQLTLALEAFKAPSDQPTHSSEKNHISLGGDDISLDGDDKKTAIIRAIELNDISFIKKILESDVSDIFPIKKESMLEAAIIRENFEVLKLLTEEFKVSADSNDLYKTAPIHLAVLQNNIDILKHLITKTSNIDTLSSLHGSALLLAIEIKNRPFVEHLLQQGADTTIETSNGENMLHVAAKTNDQDMFVLLLKTAGAQDLLLKKNIFGKTALDLAIENKSDNIIKLIDKTTPLETIQNSKPYGKEPISINQGTVLKKLRYFLTSQYRDISYFNESGHCNGFSFLREYYHAKGMEDYYFNTLELFSQWDGSDESLKKEFTDEPQKTKGYHNLGELMDQWMNDLIWFQHLTVKIGTQENRLIQNKAVEAVEADSSFLPMSICKENESLDVNDVDKINEIIHFFKRLPEGFRFEFSSRTPVFSLHTPRSGHRTAGHVGTDSSLIFYDSNNSQKTTPCTSAEEFSKRLIRTCKSLGSNEARLFWTLFVFQKNIDLLGKTHVLHENDIPKNKQESEGFQLKSPNQFTPLHIAVMFQDIPFIKRILKDGFCDVNAKDSTGKTVLDLALANDFFTGVDLLTKNQGEPPKYDENSFKKLCIPLEFDNQALIQYAIKSSYPFDLSFLLKNAIENKDLSLIKQLFDEKKAHINHSIYDSPVLVWAINRLGPTDPILELDRTIISYLFNQNPDFMLTKDGRSTLLQSILWTRDLDISFITSVLKKIPDINEYDAIGNTAVYYTINTSDPNLLTALISQGANVNLKHKNGTQSLIHALCDRYSYYCFDDATMRKNLIEYLKILLPCYHVDSQDDHKQLTNLIHRLKDDTLNELFNQSSKPTSEACIFSKDTQGPDDTHLDIPVKTPPPKPSEKL